MSIVAEIKCARCDRKYSGVRSRCPYCGARRIGRGKYSEDSDNSRGKMLISVIIMGLLVVTSAVLLFTTPIPDAEGLSPPSPSPTLNMPDESDNVSVPGSNPLTPPPSPPDEEIEEPTPPPVIEVQTVTITYNGRATTDFTEFVGQSVTLGVRVEPIGVQEEVQWLSSNRSVFEVVALNPEGTQARVTPIGVGTATLTASVGGVEAESIVRIRTR